MKNAFASKMSYFILTFVFLIITASFLFSGFDNFSMGGGASNVADVDGTPVTYKEYQTALARQVEFFNQMMGGSGVTQKQLEEMGIKDSVVDGLIQQKLILNAGRDMGIVVSLEEVKAEIRNMPYFKTNNQFDVNLYRNALQSNGYVPAQFEELISNDLKQKKVDELLNSTIVSEQFVTDVQKFKGTGVKVEGVKIGRQALSPLISVSEAEINEYLAKPENKKALEDAYSDNLSKYNKSEEVKVRHILVQGQDAKALDKAKAIRGKVNPKNFGAVASAESEDPTGKGNGGDLGWISAGRMVPEFEQAAFKMKKGEISEPVKTQFGYHIIFAEDKKAAQNTPLESVKKELAQLAVQKTKAQDLDKLLKSEEQRLMAALANNNFAEVEATAKKVSGESYKGVDVNLYDQTLNNHTLAPAEAEQVFKAAPGSVVNLGNAGTIFLVKVIAKTDGATATPSADKLKTEVTTQNQAFARKSREELLKFMNNKAKIVKNKAMM
jgi:peptidyl-prolyl cis-trans isomerase D